MPRHNWTRPKYPQAQPDLDNPWECVVLLMYLCYWCCTPTKSTANDSVWQRSAQWQWDQLPGLIHYQSKWVDCPARVYHQQWRPSRPHPNRLHKLLQPVSPCCYCFSYSVSTGIAKYYYHYYYYCYASVQHCAIPNNLDNAIDQYHPVRVVVHPGHHLVVLCVPAYKVKTGDFSCDCKCCNQNVHSTTATETGIVIVAVAFVSYLQVALW